MTPPHMKSHSDEVLCERSEDSEQTYLLQCNDAISGYHQKDKQLARIINSYQLTSQHLMH